MIYIHKLLSTSRYSSDKGVNTVVMDHLLLLLVTHVWILVDLVSGLEVPYTPDIPIQEQQRRVQEKNPCKFQNNNY